MKKTQLFFVALFLLVSCGGGGSSTTYTVGGTISGLTAAGLVLQNNTADDLTVASGAANFTFATGLADAATYAVTVKTQPTGLTCSLSAATGTVAKANVTSVVLTCSATEDLTFTPDSLIIREDAANVQVGINDDGSYIMFYTDTNDHKNYTETSTDGLNFSGKTETNTTTTSYIHHTRYILMSDGRYRTFLWSNPDAAVISLSTANGINPTQDSGTRYSPTSVDNGTIGITDVYEDPVVAGGVLMLYIGDLSGLNNVRLAVSTDSGSSFTYSHGNVLGDDSAGGGGHSYVDQFSILLPDGRRRLFVAGDSCSDIDSFISTDGRTYTLETGSRVAVSDFQAVSATSTITSVHDPVVIQLPDGRYRIYIPAMFSGENGVVSATSQ